MNDEEIARLADVVSERVFASMSKFIDALEGVVRENEQLQSKLATLELMVFGPEDDEDDDEDEDDYELVPVDEMDNFFDSESAWDPDDDDDDVLGSN